MYRCAWAPPGGQIAPVGSRSVLGERWVPSFLENLQQGLLDQPVDDARHAELSDPAIRLGYFDERQPKNRYPRLGGHRVAPRQLASPRARSLNSQARSMPYSARSRCRPL